LDDELVAAEAAGGFLIDTEVLLPIGYTQELARVLHQKRDQEGNPVGLAHQNPALDTHVYKVCLPDGRTEELAVNVIDEVVHAKCDADRN
jgi:hypothetical protein